MSTQATLDRCLRLIRLLSRIPRHSVEQLAKILSTSRRSIYRYIETLESVGYTIDKDYRSNPYISIPQNGGEDHHIIPLAENLHRIRQHEILKDIRFALEHEVQVSISGYHNSQNQVSGLRVVEPRSLSTDEAYLLAYDTHKQGIRNFKLSRIDDLEVLETPIQFPDPMETLDLFGFSGDESEALTVELELSHFAKQILIEEYPAAESYIWPIDHSDRFRFSTVVYGLPGIGRFVMGMCMDIRVIQPPALKEYMIIRAKKILTQLDQ
ncbi:transcriptional regulator [Pontibacter sp. G13]|uniref:helix-turn-helix transcriptional regulator n=1 Tax=Pontibacter sp. G13 TaxID=3074898 RepID=UPI00288B0F44|nr:transcriptional regulator [Pontibacter sp. G13]WNJ18159.1 transcriptional regulator [Pontibacter sp. G13]